MTANTPPGRLSALGVALLLAAIVVACSGVGTGVVPSTGRPLGHRPLAHALDYLEIALLDGRTSDTWGGIGTPTPHRETHSVFVAYFLSRALAIPGKIDARLVSRISGHLQDAYQAPAYGYARHAPIDSDDTAFAFRTRGLLGDRLRPDSLRLALRPFVLGELWRTFALAPATAQAPIAVRYADDDSIAGPHPEVILNILLAFSEMGEDPELSILGSLPRERGLFLSYHYPSNIYATWLAAELSRNRPGNWADEVDAALRRAQLPDGSWPAVNGGFSAAQETALALLAASSRARCEHWVRQGGSRLEGMQLYDGTWPSGILWKYVVHGTNGAGLWYSHDSFRIVSTSLAALAIHRVRSCDFR